MWWFEIFEVFWGKRGKISFSVSSCLLRGLYFVKICLFDLSCLLDNFQLNTQYKIPRTNQSDILNTFIQLVMVWVFQPLGRKSV